MAGLPPITQLGGNHMTLFDGYWSILDPQGTGQVDAASAAAFLKKSQLREPVLHKIWSMSDVGSRGYLDKQGLFMALRLIAVCQAGKQPSVANMALSDPPPTFAGIDPPVTLVINKWTIDESERAKQEQLFQSLHPVKGLLAGDKARPFMITSTLPRDTLGKIWNLSDIDKDGSLDLDEFCVATKLISLAKGGEVLPASLPPSLIPTSKVKGGRSTSTDVTASLSATSLQSDSASSHESPLPARKGSATPISVGVEWVVTVEMKSKYDGYFQGIDKDQDGYVSGEQARNLFMASNLQQPVLAHIWNLCDIEQIGKLNAEQFALAMYLIAEKVRNKDVPKELTPAMIPPSMRGKAPPLPTPAPPTSDTTTTTTTMDTMWGAQSATPLPGISTATANEGEGFGNDFSAIQELDNITSEIESIRKEKVELADDIKVKQELIQHKRGELEGFQEDIQQVAKRRESLEKEREEARAKLDHLNSEKAKFEGQIAEVHQNCDDEREEIERLKAELTAQETSNRTKAEELGKLEEQLEQLRKEEQEYRQKVEMSKMEMEKFHKANNNLASEITQVRHRIEGLKEEEQSLATAMTLYPTSSAASGNSASSGVVNISDVGKLSAELHVPHLSDHDAISARATAGSSSPVSSLSGFSTNSHLDEGVDEGGTKDDKTPSDPFGPSSSSSSSSRDPFAAFSLSNTEDSFGGRSFSGKPSVLSAFDPFGGSGGGGGEGSGGFDPFKSTGPTLAPATGEDMFRTGDPFSGNSHISASSSASSLPPLGPTSNLSSVDPFSGQDPFKADPFGPTSSKDSSAQVQPTSLWGNTGGFDIVDPFGQQQQTPTDPFASGDPFGEDPFAAKTGNNPFANSSGGGATFAGLWKQDDQSEHTS